MKGSDEQNDILLFDDYYEWQISKANSNLKKHKISFEEASEVFSFNETQYYIDETHSFDERRYYAVGYTSKQKLLIVCYTERNRIHIISARKSKAKERIDYEEKRNEFKEYGF